MKIIWNHFGNNGFRLTDERIFFEADSFRKTTKGNYIYMYDRFVRDTFGKKKIASIKYSDILQYYNYLLYEREVQLSTVDAVHCLLHPTFQLAVRDEIIRINPTEGVMADLKRKRGRKTGVRHALTIPQQRAFMDYMAVHPVYYHWWPLFTVLLGTGCRIGEALGLRWEDLDYDKRTISINHSLVYYSDGKDRTTMPHVSKPKTEAGIRLIPMPDTVKDAFDMLREEQEEEGRKQVEIDGMTNFIFYNRFGNVLNPACVNRTIKRIVFHYNEEEETFLRSLFFSS